MLSFTGCWTIPRCLRNDRRRSRPCSRTTRTSFPGRTCSHPSHSARLNLTSKAYFLALFSNCNYFVLFFVWVNSRVSSETRFAFCFAKLDAKRVLLFRETNCPFREISCFAKQPVLHVSFF
jgi:hypothetical protein